MGCGRGGELATCAERPCDQLPRYLTLKVKTVDKGGCHGNNLAEALQVQVQVPLDFGSIEEPWYASVSGLCTLAHLLSQAMHESRRADQVFDPGGVRRFNMKRRSEGTPGAAATAEPAI